MMCTVGVVAPAIIEKRPIESELKSMAGALTLMAEFIIVLAIVLACFVLGALGIAGFGERMVAGRLARRAAHEYTAPGLGVAGFDQRACSQSSALTAVAGTQVLCVVVTEGGGGRVAKFGSACTFVANLVLGLAIDAPPHWARAECVAGGRMVSVADRCTRQACARATAVFACDAVTVGRIASLDEFRLAAVITASVHVSGYTVKFSSWTALVDAPAIDTELPCREAVDGACLQTPPCGVTRARSAAEAGRFRRRAEPG